MYRFILFYGVGTLVEDVISLLFFPTGCPYSGLMDHISQDILLFFRVYREALRLPNMHSWNISCLLDRSPRDKWPIVMLSKDRFEEKKLNRLDDFGRAHCHA